MDKSVKFPAMNTHYGPGGFSSNPEKLPSNRNPGQQSHLNITQHHAPGPGSPKPTQAGTGANGKKGGR